jgi:hypothetical protein
MPEAMNNRGQVVWGGNVDTGETWIFLWDARTGKAECVQRPGMPAPGGGRFQPSWRQVAEINNHGDVAYYAYVTEIRSGMPVPGVFARIHGKNVVVAREGSPITGGTSIIAAAFPAISDTGAVVFHANVGDVDAVGVYRWQNGKIVPIAVPGVQLPGGRRLDEALYPQIDTAGNVVFVGQTRRGMGLYRWARGAIRPIVEPGDILPGLGPLRQVDPNGRRPFDLNAGGAVAFVGNGVNRDGVFVWEQGKVRLAALSEATLPAVGWASEVGAVSRQTPGYVSRGMPPGYATPPVPPRILRRRPAVPRPLGPGALPAPPPGSPGFSGPRLPGSPGSPGPTTSVASRPPANIGPGALSRSAARPMPGGPGPYGPTAGPGNPGFSTPFGGPGRSAGGMYGSPGTSGPSGPPGGPGPGFAGPYGPTAGPYGPAGGPFFGYSMGSMGISLSDDGKLMFLATVHGEQCMILATPKPAPRDLVDARRGRRAPDL